MIESLEQRTLLAVSAIVDGGWLIVHGGEGNDSVAIVRGNNLSEFQFSASTAGELVRPAIWTFLNVRKGVRIDTGAGDDTVLLEGLRVSGTVQIDTGNGDDSVVIRSTRPTGPLVWRGGGGNDSILLRQSTIQGDLQLDGGAGKDRTYLSFVHARRRFDLSDTDGPGIITFTRLSVDGAAEISTGASLDRLTIHDSTFKQNASFTTSRGDDQIRVRGTIFRQTPAVDPGTGENQIDRELILVWDFRDGAQGWKHGFADYPTYTRDVNGALVRLPTEKSYALEAGIKSLPEDLDQQGTGYKLYGINGSDDLLMFLTRELGTAAGVVPGRNYRLSYDVEFATNVGRAGRFNPAYLKVGGLGTAPRYLDVQRGSIEGFRTLNADIGIQGNSGRDASIAGLIQNGTSPPRWSSTRRAYVHPVAIKSDPQGHLWLFVGVDCAYEVPWTVFMKRVEVRVTPMTT